MIQYMYLLFWISHFGDSGTYAENTSMTTAGMALPAYSHNTSKCINAKMRKLMMVDTILQHNWHDDTTSHHILLAW